MVTYAPGLVSVKNLSSTIKIKNLTAYGHWGVKNPTIVISSANHGAIINIVQSKFIDFNSECIIKLVTPRKIYLNINQTIFSNFSVDYLILSQISRQVYANFTNIVASDSDFQFFQGSDSAEDEFGDADLFYSNFSNMIFFYSDLDFLSQIKGPLQYNNFIGAYNLDSEVVFEPPQQKMNMKQEFLIDVNLNDMIIAYSYQNIQFELANLYVNNSLFCHNGNIEAVGGVLYITDSSYIFNNSLFVSNYASAGGAIFESNSNGTITNIVNVSNTALTYGPFIASNPTKINFTFVTDPIDYLAQYINFSVSFHLDNNSDLSYTIHNASIALLDVLTLEFRLYDNFDQLFVISNISKFSLLISPEGQPALIDPQYFNSKTSTTYLLKVGGDSFQLDGYASYVKYSIQFQFLNYQKNISLKFIDRACLEGELLDPVTNLCEICPANYYSLQAASTCIQCPPEAICPGGDNLNISQGFWRDGYTNQIYPCLNDNIVRCQGGMDPASQCAYGYSGALCQGCNASIGYVSSLGDECVKCSTNTAWIWIKSIALILVSYAYEIFYIWFTNKSNKNFTRMILEQNSMDLKKQRYILGYLLGVQLFILTNFLQFAYILISYMTYLENNIVEIVNHFEVFLTYTANPSSQQSSGLSCLLLQIGVAPQDLTYIQIFITIALPFVKFFITLIFLIIQHCRGKIKRFWNVVNITIISFIFLEQSSLIQNLSKFNICVIFNLYGYSEIDLNLSCSDPYYISFKQTFVDPVLIFWAVFVPLILIGLLFYYKKSVDSTQTRRRLGGIINQFRSSRYYWSIVIMATKLSMLFVISYFQNPRNTTLVGFGIMSLYYFATSKFSPFGDKSLLEADRKGAAALIVCFILFNQAVGNTFNPIVIFYAFSIFGIVAMITALMIFNIVKRFRALRLVQAKIKLGETRNDSSIWSSKDSLMELLKKTEGNESMLSVNREHDT